jgi:hypothetical protein
MNPDPPVAGFCIERLRLFRCHGDVTAVHLWDVEQHQGEHTQEYEEADQALYDDRFPVVLDGRH